jgi:hypothetical protein
VRLALLAAILAVAGLCWLLVFDRTPQKSRRETPVVDPDPPPVDRDPPPKAMPDPATDPQGFLAECARRGGEAVPDILAFLESGEDKQLEPRWKLVDGKLATLPTLRSLYIEALRRIPGSDAAAALKATLQRAAKSIEESYQVAYALHERGERDWAPTLLERATGYGTPPIAEFKRAMVALAARSEPDTTAEFIVERAPRNDDATEPRIPATALAELPIGHATSAAQRLMADQQVTPKAKSYYVRSLCARPEVEAIRALTTMAERGELDEQVRLDAAYAAANGDGFRLDLIDYQKGVAKGDADATAAARDRFDRRFAEVKLFIRAALGVDVDSGTGSRAASLRKILERQRKPFSPPR